MSELFLNLKPGEQKTILKNFKSKLGLTWIEVADLLGVNRSMIFFYCNDDCRLPVRHTQKLCQVSGISQARFRRFETVELIGKRRNFIKKPELDEDLAEFIGLLSGDGCLTVNYAVVITCSALVDSHYVEERVSGLFRSLFEVEPKVWRSKNVAKCRVYSKELHGFISETFNFPVGKKKGRLKIPSKILNDKCLLAAFLRGVFDTDGSFHRHHKNTAAVEFISKSPEFLSQLKGALQGLGFKASQSGKSVYIYDTTHIDRFFEIIQPKNLKHNLKYSLYRKLGRVIAHRECRKLLDAAVV